MRPRLIGGTVRNEEQSQSPAFKSAALRSERLCVAAFLAFMSMFVLVTIVRVFVVHTAGEVTAWGSSLSLDRGRH